MTSYNWPYIAIVGGLLLLAGVGEYLHLVPAGTFSNLLLIAIGLIAPSPLSQKAGIASVMPVVEETKRNG